jgi:hypothetical protein
MLNRKIRLASLIAVLVLGVVGSASAQQVRLSARKNGGRKLSPFPFAEAP